MITCHNIKYIIDDYTQSRYQIDLETSSVSYQYFRT